MTHASGAGWVALAGAATAASFGGLAAQLCFAVLAVGVIGMAHGASDLAIVPRPQRPLFVTLYLTAGAAYVAWWVADPAIALPLFLIISAVHFGLEDAPHGSVLERVARGVSLIATPATLHVASLSNILLAAGAPEGVSSIMAGSLAVSGAIAGGALVILGIQRSDMRLLFGKAALLLLPPLVGFSVGFLVLHALPQTIERKVQLRCSSIASYLRAVSPVLGAAVLLVALIGITMLSWDPTGVRPLFAAIAALAIPHLLITPWFAAHVHTSPVSSSTPASLPKTA